MQKKTTAPLQCFKNFSSSCCPSLIAVGYALEAWRILEDLTNHVDLVLTEVAMPYLSGIDLLSKIMNHKTRKNVPVISKNRSHGAVDFLVKPIRKNELKNLWQHVWRKCHSSSGSGSESGIQTQKSTKSKSVERSENNTDSNDKAENGSFDLDDRDRSDNGSGTQIPLYSNEGDNTVSSSFYLVS
ncbi:hypothetical protein RND71_025047 [Anisodus tanguticus]|uniref:Response regulatory domain-containing protein n=1 Tax=Anisodus tanguticus TaxID=243964 RepID=A0AAE1RS73_9SOLA|nr:hypothetical protein RND71_025047 [Anisodus tanguticus]